MIYKRKKGKFYRIFNKIALVILVLSISVFVLFEFKARDLVYNTVDNELEIHAMLAIDSAVADILSKESVDYTELIIKNVSEDGKVTSLEANTLAINTLKAKLSKEITEYIRKDYNARVGVPAGAFTGIVLLSSIGPDITVTLNINGSVTTNIKSDFTSAGINQTLHRIYLVVDADVSLTCPIIAHETSFITEYDLCQTVIVGNTPDMLADFSSKTQ